MNNAEMLKEKLQGKIKLKNYIPAIGYASCSPLVSADTRFLRLVSNNSGGILFLVRKEGLNSYQFCAEVSWVTDFYNLTEEEKFILGDEVSGLFEYYIKSHNS